MKAQGTGKTDIRLAKTSNRFCCKPQLKKYEQILVILIQKS